VNLVSRPKEDNHHNADTADSWAPALLIKGPNKLGEIPRVNPELASTNPSLVK